MNNFKQKIVDFTFPIFVIFIFLLMFIAIMASTLKVETRSNVQFSYLKGRVIQRVDSEHSGKVLLFRFEQGEDFRVKSVRFPVIIDGRDVLHKSILNKKKIISARLGSDSFSSFFRIIFNDYSEVRFSSQKYSLEFN